MTQLIWLTIALPLVGMLFNGIFGRWVGYKVVRIFGPLMILLAFLVGVGASYETALREGQAVTVPLWIWATIGGFNAPINLFVDPLSMQMVLIVTGVGFLIHIYATDYMIHRDESGHAHPDRDYARFFAFLNLFIASMLILVLGDNYFMMFVGWELVGVSSYLLIGFWFDRPSEEQEPIDLGQGKTPVKMAPLLSPAASGMKAFIVNRIGDVGFALGIFLIWTTFGTLQFNEVFAEVNHIAKTSPYIPSLIAALLFIGAIGKSAQIPLYVWLPDAMAGPTPVSALIHAATMVTAGIYMIVRSNEIYSLAPAVLLIIAFIGAFTALFAASIALVQVDLKRILAYSTISQLGYMFLAVGVGGYTAAMFHLTTHAFFKALLFLGAGSVMHAMHDVIDIRRMGGLKDKMKITYWTFIIGGLALSGFPLLSGFFSKDEILANAFEKNGILWAIGIIVAGLTAFYTFRAIFITFHGKPRDQHLYDHAHENRAPVTVVLVILAVLALFSGLLNLPGEFFHELGINVPSFMEHWLDPIYGEASHRLVKEHHLPFGTEVTLLLTSAVVAVSGIGVAYFFYMVRPSIPQTLARSTRPLFALMVNKYKIDELYNAIIGQPALKISQSLSRDVDTTLLDLTLIDGLGKVIGGLGSLFSKLQSGYVGHYALATFVGVLLMITYFFLG